MNEQVVARFWSMVDRRGPNDCWLWKAGIASNGYGNFWLRGKTVSAHRFSAALHGHEVAGKVVMHSCDVKNCVNPWHLSIGTQADNVHDMISKGREALKGAPAGDLRTTAKLNHCVVAEIRRRAAAGEMQKDLADEFGVHESTIGHAVTFRTWRLDNSPPVPSRLPKS